MTALDKGKMLRDLSPDERRAGEHSVSPGDKDGSTPVAPFPRALPTRIGTDCDRRKPLANRWVLIGVEK